MALTTIPVELLTLDDGVTITVDDNSDVLSLVSTDADDAFGPFLNLHRNSSSPADNDGTGVITFAGENDNNEEIDYAQIQTASTDVSDGTEDGTLIIQTMVAGTSRDRITISPSETAVNENSVDVDFRVEGDSQANLLFIDASTDRIGIGTSSPTTALQIAGLNQTNGTLDLTPNAAKGSHSSFVHYGTNGDWYIRSASASGNVNIQDTGGNLLVGTTASRSLSGVTPTLFKEGTGYNDSAMALVGNTGTSAATAPLLLFGRSRGTSNGTSTSVASGDRLGGIFFTGADGTDVESLAAVIQASVDGTPGSNDMPGRLQFFTTPDGSESTVERMRIHNGGLVSFNNGIELGNGFGGAASNTLDDYEEGTFTPGIAVTGGGMGSVTYAYQQGHYTIVGRMVSINAVVGWTVASSNGSGYFQVTGLPVACVNDSLKRHDIPIVGEYNITRPTDVISLSAESIQGSSSLYVRASRQSATWLTGEYSLIIVGTVQYLILNGHYITS